MLVDIDNMTDHTVGGKSRGLIAFNSNIPTTQVQPPLRSMPPSTRKLADLGLVGGGAASRQEKYLLVRNGKEKPYHHMIVFVLAGKLRVETPSEDLVAKVGDVIHIPSWTPRRIELIDGDAYKEVYFRCKAEPTCREFWTDQLTVRASTEYAALARAVEGLCEENEKDDAGRETAALYADIIGRLLVREMSTKHVAAVRPVWQNLRGVVEEIRRDPAADWTVQQLCGILHVSRTQLFRIFRQAFGKSPIQLVAEVRMNHAQQLLVTTDLPLDMIASEIGYSNAYSFSNALMKYAGIRPGALRRRVFGT